LPRAVIDGLTQAVRSIPCADVQWLIEDAQLAEIGEILGAADRLRILHPQAIASCLASFDGRAKRPMPRATG
jgi:hypothetical protein